METLDIDESSVFGTLSAAGTKKPHGLDRPSAAPRIGFSSSSKWIWHILNFRREFEKFNGATPSWHIPKLSYDRDIEDSVPISYGAARRKLMLMRIGAGRKGSEQFTLHTPKNCAPARSNEMSFSPDGRGIGQCASTSRRSDLYGRSTCTQELLIRNTIVRNINEG